MEDTPYKEALRYIANAKEVLKKAGKKDGEYADIKYVQMASGTAYNAVLIALDEYLLQKEGNKFIKPKSIEEYRTRIAKQNKKLLKILNTVYSDLHISGYYMGTPSVTIIKRGFDEAIQIIEYIKP